MPDSISATRGATAQQLADLLELTPRRVQQLAQLGVFPKVERGRYPLVVCVRAYIAYWKDRAEGRFADNELDLARLKREQLEVRKRVIEVAKAEGSVVALEHHEEVVRKMLGKIRAIILAIPGAWGSRVLGIASALEGLQVMRRLADETVEGVAASAPEFDITMEPVDDTIPDDFPGVVVLRKAEIVTMGQLAALDDLTAVKGIGPKTAEAIEEVLAA